MLAILSATLCGTLFVYQGQEIGLENYSIDVPFDEAFDDICTVNTLRVIEQQRRSAVAPGAVIDMSDVREQVRLKARDNGRSPMQWNNESPHAGFTHPARKPWKSSHTNIGDVEVASQDSQPLSVLNFWRIMIKFRRLNSGPIVYGSMSPDERTLDDSPVFAYCRVPHECSSSGQILLVVLNMTARDNVPYTLPGNLDDRYISVIDTSWRDQIHESGQSVIHLTPYQGLVFEVLGR